MSSMRYRRIVYFKFRLEQRVSWPTGPGGHVRVWCVVNRRWTERCGAASINEYGLVPALDHTQLIRWVSEADIRREEESGSAVDWPGET